MFITFEAAPEEEVILVSLFVYPGEYLIS